MRALLAGERPGHVLLLEQGGTPMTEPGMAPKSFEVAHKSNEASSQNHGLSDNQT